MTHALGSLVGGGAWSWLSAPWQVDVVQRALAEAGVLGVIGGCLGCWVVLFGLSYSAESLSHAMFPGLALAAILGTSLVVGGLAGVVVAALAIALCARVPVIGSDTSVAVVISSLFGLGVLLALSPASPAGIQDLLFGDLLGVSNGDLASAVVVGAVVLAALRLMHAQLLLVGFDRAHARALGGRPGVADTGLLVLLALATVVAAQGVGTLLAPAFLVGPAATAALFARRVPSMMALASALSLGAAVTGMYLSFYAGTAAGASVAGVIVVEYVVAAVVARRRSRARPTFAGQPLPRGSLATADSP